MWRMFFRFSSIFSVASALVHSMSRLRSFRNTVVTMKKMSSRNAMSAIDEVGIVLSEPDFFLNPLSLMAI